MTSAILIRYFLSIYVLEFVSNMLIIKLVARITDRTELKILNRNVFTKSNVTGR